MKGRMSKVFLAFLQGLARPLELSDVVIECLDVMLSLFRTLALGIRARSLRLLSFGSIPAHVFEIFLISEREDKDHRDRDEDEVQANHAHAAGNKSRDDRSGEIGH